MKTQLTNNKKIIFHLTRFYSLKNKTHCLKALAVVLEKSLIEIHVGIVHALSSVDKFNNFRIKIVHDSNY